MLFGDRGRGFRGHLVRGIICALSVITAVLMGGGRLSHADEFKADTLGDYGNVTVMEVNGTYDAENADGTANTSTRQAIAKEFYRLHKDEYDFLVIFTNFDFAMPKTETVAFYTGVKNDTSGIGKPLFDNSVAYGSRGRLQGTVDMGSLANLVLNPMDPGFEATLDTLSHELMHRWAAHITFRDALGNPSPALLGKDSDHWSFLLSTDASLMYGNMWQDNGNGTFTSVKGQKYYSPLDLYLMGFLDMAQVAPMLLIDNPDIDPERASEVGVTIPGSPRYVKIEDIIAAEGQRIPGPDTSQRNFKAAFIFITLPGTFAADELYGLENIRNGWITRYSALTDGIGTMQVTATPITVIPVNPGPVPPIVVPRVLPASINEGIAWLLNSQKADGSWPDTALTAARDTAEAIIALKPFDAARQQYTAAQQWLNSFSPVSTDYLSRRLEAAATAGQDTTDLINILISRQNRDGGWGSSEGLLSSPIETALALRALARSGYGEQSVLLSAFAYLRAHQGLDKGWGSDEASSLETTARVLSALNAYKGSYQLQDQLAAGSAWLLQHQNPDNGFGNSPGTLADTALAAMTLAELDLAHNARSRALTYIKSLQSENGSWNGSAYQTALALEAIYKAALEPDLAVSNADISFLPSVMTNYPANIVISAVVTNLGATAVPAADVVLYEGGAAPANKISGQSVSFPGLSATVLTFSVLALDAKERTYYVVVDPENLIKEADKTNNSAFNKLASAVDYDFEILPGDFMPSPNPVELTRDVKLTARIANRGRQDAYNVHVRYYIDEPGAPFDLATATVDIPAGGIVQSEIIWKTSRPGTNLPVTVWVDPYHEFNELAKTNNRAVAPLTVVGLTDPNLSVSYKDIVVSPIPVQEGGDTTITSVIRNTGYATASNSTVNFYLGNPGTGGVLLGTQGIPSLSEGGTTSVSVNWNNISTPGTQIIYVKVDPEGLIKETAKDDNDAFITVQVMSLPDLAISANSISFNPQAPKDGDVVSITVTIRNLGEQTATNVPVRVYDGSNLIGAQTVSAVVGNSQTAVVFPYSTTGKSGAHQLTVKVDPDNTIIERSKENNTASKTFGVQDANLWLTELYISPNGDGVKDSTQLFFSLTALETVKIQIVSERNETVRTIGGPELEKISSGNITWDGLNDDGAVVNDGQYHLQVVGTNNNVLGSLLVTVDNNRSPLSRALGTDYLLNSNLTCMLPDVEPIWLPDESGLIFSINDINPHTPEYPRGIYMMGPDGQDIMRFAAPADWFTDNQSSGSISPQLSPDGGKIAFSRWKYDATTNTSIDELWVVGSDGQGLTLLGSWDTGLTYYGSSLELFWAPDAKHIAFTRGCYAGDGCNVELWIMNSEDLIKRKIDTSSDYLTGVTWSQDSGAIAYTVRIDGSFLDLRKSDTTGNVITLATLDYLRFREILLVGSRSVVVSENGDAGYYAARPERYSVRLYDVNRIGESVLLSDAANSFALSPDGKQLALVEYVGDKANVKRIDAGGNASLLYDAPLVMMREEGYPGNIDGLTWSRDGNKIAFINRAYEEVDRCIYKPSVVTVDVAARKYIIQEPNGSGYIFTSSPSKAADCADWNQYYYSDLRAVGWLSDSDNFLLKDSWDNFVLNTTTGEKTYLPERISSVRRISPLGRYIDYYDNPWQGSVCYGRGSTDLWAISSLLNLTADLRVVKSKSAVILKGIAADLNFEGYKIEYADLKTPTQWNLAQPPSNVPVDNGVFTTWVPPYEGTFYLQLTVWDKAGNIAVQRKRVSWGLSSSITNIYKSSGIFSPNNDGVKDTVSLNYTVLEPVHLEFTIYDANGLSVKKFYRDHAAPGAERIIWDGTDDAGRVVPDGDYTIKVFDFEFYVDVDNTPPEVNLALGQILQNTSSDYPPLALVANLMGHAYDSNLKSWVIEYGEGDNPETWYEYSRGEASLAARDPYGYVITDPVGNTTITQFINQGIASLANKRFRITAEDTAGNKSTALTSVMEEKLLLYSHVWGNAYPPDQEYFSISGNAEYPPLGLRMLHQLEGLETLRIQLSNMNLQYWSNLQWHDAEQASNYVDGDIVINWDRSLLSDNVDAVRIKAVDIYGYEHYSNAVKTQSLFTIEPCAFLTAAARNFLFERLTLLRLQIKSSQDARYAEWTDYRVMHAPNIPTGIFSLAPLPDLNAGAGYRFRLIGVDESGKEHTGDEPEPDASCGGPAVSLKLTPKLNYAAEAGCGLPSDGRVRLSAELIATGYQGGLSQKSLSYYIQNQGGLQLLRTFDLMREAWGAVDIDTVPMPEGYYPLQVRLTYTSAPDHAVKELTGSGTLVVDRVQPEAKITYPGRALTVCPAQKFDSMGAWLGLPIEGVARDNSIIRKYELYYGFGETPEIWHPALTRKIIENKVQTVPIIGDRKVGNLGDWQLDGIHGPVTVKLKVIDIAGNTSCDTTSLTVKDLVEISALTVDKQLFSPNGDSVFDSVTADYRIDEVATVDISVFSLINGPDGRLIPAADAVKTIASGIQHLEGMGSIAWDGTDDSGGVVADGIYGIVIFVTDTCGNKNSRFISVKVDNTPPVVQIAYPGPSDTIGTMVEIRGTADDLNLGSYVLEAASAGSPDVWLPISAQAAAVKDGILGTWNTFGLVGLWNLRLTTYDIAGNRSVTMVTINLGTRRALVRNLAALPRLFSPNSDGKLDSADISYELTEACSVNIQIMDPAGLVLKNYGTSVPSAGLYSYIWNGKSDQGATVPEGIYTITFVATSSSNSSVFQTEAITLAVDTTSPLIDIKQPADLSYIRSADVVVNGTISDLNLSEYSITLTGDSGIIPVDSGNTNRVNDTFSLLNGLSEGMYTLKVKAKDFAENLSEKNIVFTIDRTAPKVSLNAPREGEIFGNARNLINITGSVVEKNLESYAVSYGSGDNPSVWNALSVGNTLPHVPGLFDWKAGRTDSIPDGLYTLLLSAKDKAGLTGESRVKIIIDNTPPEVSFASPKEGGYIKAPMDIRGTAADANLQKYTLELSDGLCSSAYKWAPLKVAATSVKEGVLGQLQLLPPDGNYCLRLSGIDKVENSSETKINIKIDTIPPVAPVLTGTVENRSDIRLTWQPNTETDLAGYDLYREGMKLNTAMIRDTQYLDQNMHEGVYSYALRAIDLAGNESRPSGEVKLKIDLTGPDAKIRSPQDNSRVSGILDIKGTAYSSDDFKEYRIYTGKGAIPDSWSLIRKSPVPVPYGTLAQWDTAGIPEGTLYSIKLEAEDLSGNISTSGIRMVIDNTPPAAPVLISAVPNLSDVALSWRANTEQDLIGYLLYRNDQLVTATGVVIGNLKPYLITGTTYSDKALPDGKYMYYLSAMDQAGNVSEQSNAIELTIDTHPPHMTIVSPVDKSKFDKPIIVKTESPDNDIAAVQFQYKKTQDIAWTNLGTVLTRQPYAVNLDPSTLTLTYGDFSVRAVATDTNGNTDPSPAAITLTYTDITPPGNIQNLKAAVNGKDVALSWSADTDTDLEGYSVYRISGSVRTKLTAAPIKDALYHDDSLADGDYTYEVTALDKTGNETQPSNPVAAKIYAPVINQPYTPVGIAAIELTGGNATVGSSTEVFADRGTGPVSQGAAIMDATGQFVFGATLEPGLNKFTARTTDASGNISRVSDLVAVIFGPAPAAPTGLIAAVSDQDAALSWNANTEADLAGYNLFRDGVKLNASVTVTPVSGSASATYYGSDTYRAENAFDQDPSTCWMSTHGYYGSNAVWFEIGLSSPELISGLDIQWLDAMHAGWNYAIEAWSGYAWITVSNMYNPWLAANHLDIIPSYRTDRLRINITKSTDYHHYSNPIGISEIIIHKENLLTGRSYHDTGLQDGHYSYTLTAVNYYGFESQPSSEAKAVAGDVTPPAAPVNLTAAVSVDNVGLNWADNTEPDLAGYNIYRFMSEGWVKLNNSLLKAITYTDAGLPNGTYTYRVTAVDVIGNESQPSSEVTAVVFIAGTSVPVKPMISFPTVSGVSIVLESGTTDIAGSAAPGSIVSLFKDGSNVGETLASATDSIKSLTMDTNAYGESLSPDGTLLFYGINEVVWLKDMTTGLLKQISQNAYGAGWSPQGDRLAYSTYGSSGKYHIMIYDLQTGGTTPLTDDPAADESSLAWAPDGRRIAFSSNRGGAYNIWLKDLTSGTLSQLTDGGDVFTLKFSPDGSRLAYFVESSLYILDLADGTTELADSQTDYYSVDWSPDGGSIVFISDMAGPGHMYTYNTRQKVLQLVAHRDGANISQPFWTPDNRIVFALRDGSRSSLGMVPAAGQVQPAIIRDNLDLNAFDRVKSGAIVYKDNNILNLLYLKGYFVFRDVALAAGDNLFTAVASDEAGTPAGLSDEISVFFDTSALPDLEITAENIYLYPLVPVAGELLDLHIVVRNRGLTELRDAEVAVYLTDSGGNRELLKSAVVPYIGAGAEEVISLSRETTASVGRHRITVVADPQGKITEKRKDNNYADRELYVAGGEGISVTTLLEPGQLRAAEDLSIDLTLINSGLAKAGLLRVQIEDNDGNSLISLVEHLVQLPYGYQERLKLAWNSGVTYAGTYRVHAVLSNEDGLLAEDMVPFAILPDIAVSSSLLADRTTPAPHEAVLLTATIENRGSNYITSRLRAIMNVVDATGRTVFSDAREVGSLLPGGAAVFSSVWNSAAAFGIYTAHLEVYLGAVKVSDSHAVLSMQSTPLLAGSVRVAAASINAGSQVTADYTVVNQGGSYASDIFLKFLVLDPEAGTLMHTQEEWLNLNAGESVAGRIAFSTAGYALKTYQLVLQSTVQGHHSSLARDIFIVRDDEAPVLHIQTPIPGRFYHASFELSVSAGDAASGVASVQYQVDRGAWQELPVADISSGRYAAVWRPLAADEGRHLIHFRATDKAGNVSEPLSTSLFIDMTPPLLTLSTLSEGSRTNSSLLNVAGAVTDNSGLQSLLINDIPVTVNPDGTFSYPVLLQDGLNTLAVKAKDLADNETTITRTIRLDQQIPVITITAPADNQQTRSPEIAFTGMVSEPATILVSVNGVAVSGADPEGSSFSILVALDYGVNTLEVTATDLAGNSSTEKRTVTCDDRGPALAVTSPPEDIKTNQSSMVIGGTVSDLTSVRLAVTMDGAALTPAVVEGSFSLTVAFTEEKVYQVRVTAADAVGNETTVQRNIIYDKTPPQAPALISPADGSVVRTDTVDIAGTAEPGTLVRLGSELSTQADQLTGAFLFTRVPLVPGRNTFTFAALDAAGNRSEQTAYTLIFAVSEPSLSGSIAASPADIYQGEAVTLAYRITNADNRDLSGLLLRVLVSDAATNGLQSIVERVVSVPADTTSAGFFSLGTAAIIPGTYTVVLQVDGPLFLRPKTLDSSLFSIGPGLEITRSTPDIRNLLVWVNDGCGPQGGPSDRTAQSATSGDSRQDFPNCIRLELLDNILSAATDRYYPVYSPSAFGAELRNPYYTDMLILGNRSPLKQASWEEVRERVNSGAGLLSALWTQQETNSAEAENLLLGVARKGSLPEAGLVLRTVASPISEAGLSTSLFGPVEQVEALPGTTVAGWFGESELRGLYMAAEEDKEDRDLPDMTTPAPEGPPWPAIVLNQYGRGKTVYYAFDPGVLLGGSLSRQAYRQISDLIRQSLSYVHGPGDQHIPQPGVFVPAAITFRSHGPGFDLKVSQAFSPALRLLDPAAPAWVDTNPWSVFLHVNPGEARSIRWYALIPDRADVFTLRTDVEILQNGQYTPYSTTAADFVVGHDLQALSTAVLALLQTMTPSADPAVLQAIKYVRAVQSRSALLRSEMSRNISDILTAINWLLQADSDVTTVRQKLDQLLRGWESRYYFGFKRELSGRPGGFRSE